LSILLCNFEIVVLSVYNAISLEETNLLGGSTQPVIASVGDDDGNFIGKYVVKIFKQRAIEQYQPTNKEIYTWVLAKEFDLNIPDIAIVKVDKWFIDELKKRPKYQKFDISSGFYFASMYIENHLNYKSGLPLNKYENWEVENIFAFDVLVRNADRREKKPNLFFCQKSPYIIDHEHCLDIQNSFLEYIDSDGWRFMTLSMGKGSHLFRNYLRKHSLEHTFDTFSEILRSFNISVLDSYGEQLEELGQNVEDLYFIKSYLQELKDNRQIFFQLVEKLIV